MRSPVRACRVVLAAAIAVAVLNAQQGPGAPGQYSGPNVLSRWSRQSGVGLGAPTSLRGFLTTSYGYLGGLTGPVKDFSGQGNVPINASNSVLAGGGLNLRHIDARSSVNLGYLGNYTYTNDSNAYRGMNHDLNLNYERQLTRRWGFYTGHTAGTQSTILGLARPTTQRNFFDQAYTVTNEALDARLQFFNSGAGMFFQKSSRLVFSIDGGLFAVNRTSPALVSSRGERAQGEVAYRTSRRQSIGLVYSFSHFYFRRSFGESYVHNAMLSYTRLIGRRWTFQLAGGTYQAQSERLRQVPVDPYIAALTGQSSTIEVFQGNNLGLTVVTSLNGNFRKQRLHLGYRRAVDPGNGITLTALNNLAQAAYEFVNTRKLSMGVSLFATRMNPILTGTDRNSQFQSFGGGYNVSYRLTNSLFLTGNVGLHRIDYHDLGVRRNRRSTLIGLAFSPGEWSLFH